MRLLFLNHNVAWSGGTFFRALAVARELARRGHHVRLLSISTRRRWGAERQIVDGVEIVQTPDWLWGIGRTGWDPFDTLWRIAHVRRSRWDVIHAWDSRPVVILPALAAKARNPRAPLLLDWADWWGRGGTQAERPGLAKRVYGPVETFFEESFRTRADGSTVISAALYQRAAALGVRREAIRLLPQGCEAPRGSAPSREIARERLGIAAGTPLLVTVGKILPADAVLLFASIPPVLDRCAQARLVLIGRHGAAVPAALTTSGRVAETGFVSEAVLQDYISACDALIVPLADTLASRARWPSKTNPFLAAGRAVVITRVGDLPALLEREGAAFVAEPTAAALALATIAALEDDEGRIRCGQRAQALARERLAWPVLVDDLLAFYRQLAPPGPSAPAD